MSSCRLLSYWRHIAEALDDRQVYARQESRAKVELNRLRYTAIPANVLRNGKRSSQLIADSGEAHMRGGYRTGAGRPGWRQKVEGYWAIDIRRLARLGPMKYGRVFGWGLLGPCDERTAPLKVHVGVESISITRQLGNAIDGSPMPPTIVRIETTPCHFGGSRLWFRCPSCQQRVALLYFSYHKFACRRCLGLAYASQSLSPIDRSWCQQQRIESMLAGKAGEWDGRSKPRRMHRATFERLCASLAEVQGNRLEMAASAAAQWLDANGHTACYSS